MEIEAYLQMCVCHHVCLVSHLLTVVTSLPLCGLCLKSLRELSSMEHPAGHSYVGVSGEVHDLDRHTLVYE